MQTTAIAPKTTGNPQADSVAAIALARRKGWLYSQEPAHRRVNRLKLPYGTRNILHAIVDGDHSTINYQSSHFFRLIKLGLIIEGIGVADAPSINWARINPPTDKTDF